MQLPFYLEIHKINTTIYTRKRPQVYFRKHLPHGELNAAEVQRPPKLDGKLSAAEMQRPPKLDDINYKNVFEEMFLFLVLILILNTKPILKSVIISRPGKP